jgi:cytochrome c553
MAPLAPFAQRGLSLQSDPIVSPRRHPVAISLLPALAGAAVALAASGSHAAGDVKSGRQKALQCQTCHGLDGLAKQPEAPNLAGQTEIYLVKAMTDYKSGARKNEMMSVVAEALSASDIADLAAYYAAIEVQVMPPPK